jgi:hypothetical protein
MRLIVLVIAFVLRAAVVAEAQTPQAPAPDALNAARELLAVMSPDMIGQTVQGMTAQIWPSIQQQLGPKVDQATLAELREEFVRSLQQFVSDSMQDAPAIYARYFTADELRQIAAFYKTPAGAKALQTLPKVTADYFGTMMPRMAGFQQQMNGRIQAILEKHGYPN